MNPENVIPAKWRQNPNNLPIILYADVDYAIIWGTYENNQALGARWNGERNEVGFPNHGGNPTWHVEPDIIAIGILNHLLTLPEDRINRQEIEIAIRQLTSKMNRNN